jgi:hypothetical protein
MGALESATLLEGSERARNVKNDSFRFKHYYVYTKRDKMLLIFFLETRSVKT